MNKSISIIIPNYNGKKLLEENLPSLIENAMNCEIIIVDDGSTDTSVQFIEKNYPFVRTIAHHKNRGFPFAVNTGVKEAKGEIIYILNSDVKVTNGFLEPLMAHFDRDDVFAVSSTEVRHQEPAAAELNADVGIPLVKFKWGIFWYWYEKSKNGSGPIEVYSVSGGHSAYSREKFLDLGGFDALFRPFYGEDGDICWRAWKRGWASLIEPKSRVMHEGQATIGKFHSPDFIKKIHWKNRILVVWKNIASKDLLLKHIFFLMPELIIFPLIGKKEFTAAFFAALKQLPELLEARKKNKSKDDIYTDRALFKRFSHQPKLTPFRILYLHETSRISGAENSLLNLVRHIDVSRFKPIFILPEGGPLPSKLREMGVEVNLMELPSIRKSLKAHRVIYKIRRLVKEQGIELIHSNSIRTHIYSAAVGRMEDVPVIWHERNLVTKEIIDPDRLLSFLPDRIICNSKAIAKRFEAKRSINNKVKVIYNGVDLERFNPSVNSEKVKNEFGLNDDSPVIGIASRFSKDKGHEYFLKEASIIKKVFGKAKFLVIGGPVFKEDAHREKYLKTFSDRLGLRDSVVFCGFRDDTPQIFNALDILVLASRAEPCGRVLFEAMASGKPIIATNSGGTPEIVPDGIAGVLIPPFKAGAMSEAAIQLLKDKDKARDMGSRGREWVERNFSIERNVRETEDVYLELLNK
ncbi:MAG: hypothetical protein A2987_05810 [Omnitrophica bacterium RIFCSPLOWO2_01_FULL_45_10]|nr:MAG: hypothetical protein A2987_05810 [Omnitrophica bacterium RIFCSPLOWO2_01_FULL_45_10]